MAIVRYSRRAESDLDGIAEYTLGMWGERQLDNYMGELEACCVRLAERPLLGRACEDVRPGLRRMEHGRHVVFYRKTAKGILVVRVLHRAMMPSRWSMDDS